MDLLNRWRKHRKRDWWPLVARMEIEYLPCRSAALAAERQAIILERPLHNQIHNVAAGDPDAITWRERWNAWSDGVHCARWARATPSMRLARLGFLAVQVGGGWFSSVLLLEFAGISTAAAVFAFWMLVTAGMAGRVLEGPDGYLVFKPRARRMPGRWRRRVLRAVLLIR